MMKKNRTIYFLLALVCLGLQSCLFQEEDYFDESILSNCTNEFRNVARVIGETLYDSNFLIGDSFLHIRVIDLIARKKLSAQENEKFTQEIATSNLSDKNKIVINGVNVTELRFFSIKKL